MKRPCLVPGCAGSAHYRGRCRYHAKQNERIIPRAGREGQQIYGLRRWKMLREQVLFEQPLCACGCGEIAEEVHHIVSIEEGGAIWDRANLQAMTKVCHSRETAKEVNERGKVAA